MSRIVVAALAVALVAGASSAEAQWVVAAKDVPPGQRPPPGMCRVWINGVPPGRQPAVTDCVTARLTAPLNSRIIVGDLTPFPGQGKGKTRRARDNRTEPWWQVVTGRVDNDRRGRETHRRR